MARRAVRTYLLAAFVIALAAGPKPRPATARQPGTPVLGAGFATYLGGEDLDDAYAATVDDQGFVYLAGETRSADFPVVGGVQAKLAGNSDAFVAKLTPDGRAIVYSTFLGGRLRDYANAIAVTADGSVYVAGPTASPDFPTKNAYQPRPGGTLGGIQDFFVARLAPDGQALLYSTYLGGQDWEEPLGIAATPAGAAVVVGQTASPNFPVKGGPGTQRPCARQYVNCPDATVTVLAPDGQSLLWSAILGGDESDVAYGVAVAQDGQVAVVGTTHSRNFPVAKAFQARYAGGTCLKVRRDCDDAFVALLAADGETLTWSTYLGGTADDRGYGVAVAPDGDVVVTGLTNSADFPVHAAAQAAVGGGECQVINELAPCPDAFVTAFPPAGQALRFGTYLGGNSQDAGRAVVVDGSGRIGVTGETESRNFPVRDAWKARHGGGQLDGIFTLLDATGSLIASSYLGGREDDKGEGVGVSEDGEFAVGGSTGPAYPVLDAVQPDFGGGDSDALAVQLAWNPGDVPSATPTITPTGAPPTATATMPVATLTPVATTPAPPEGRLYLPALSR